MSNKPLEVNCPSCQTKALWDNSNTFRPFCSKRCKDGDFIGWANEENKISNTNLFDDVFSDALHNDEP